MPDIETPASVNVELLQKVMSWAQAEHDKRESGGIDSKWFQRSWCGTSHCVAGHAALLTEWSFIELPKPEIGDAESDAYDEDAWIVYEEGVEMVKADGTSVRVHGYRMQRGSEIRPVEEIALDELSIRYRDGGRFFFGDNTIEELWDIADGMSNGAVRRPGASQ